MARTLARMARIVTRMARILVTLEKLGGYKKKCMENKEFGKWRVCRKNFACSVVFFS